MIYNFPKNLKTRAIFPKIVKLLKEPEILLLYGMRQTGKTSLLYLLIEYLKKHRRVVPEQIFFFDLENIADFQQLEELADFEDLVKIINRQFSFSRRKQKAYVFIDEIQHLANPASLLKYVYDHYHDQIKFIVTGSSSLEIKQKFTDALTGRVFRFEVLPLDYQEFLRFSRLQASPDSFAEYVVFGGFPAVTLKRAEEVKIRLLKEIYSLYVRRDIKDLGAIADILSFNKLTGILAAQAGGLVSEINLSNTVGVSRPTIKNYLFLLQNTFIIHLLPPFFTNPKKEITKTPKLYFNDNGIRNAALDNFKSLSSRADAGALAENTMFSELKKQYGEKIRFWRNDRGQEVDFVIEAAGGIIPIENKYQAFRRPEVTAGMGVFIKKYQPRVGMVLTKNFSGELAVNGCNIRFIPGWKKIGNPKT